MATSQQIETWIAEAEAKRHEVATGGAVIEFMRDGRRMTRKISSIEELNSYIATLKSELVEAQIAEGITPTRRRRAIGIAWSN